MLQGSLCGEVVQCRKKVGPNFGAVPELKDRLIRRYTKLYLKSDGLI